MNNHEDPKLARHVEVDTSDARIDRLWDRVKAGLGEPRRSFRLAWAGAAACALAGATLLVVRAVHPHTELAQSAWEGARLETGADALSVTLVDGSTLKLDPSSRVEVGDRTPAAVKLVLARGRIACDVTHRPGRSFVVAAGGVEVRVVGTRFTVSTEQSEETTRVEVRVERGVVEVRGAGPSGEIVRVEAGRSWSQVTRTGASPPSETPPPETAPPESAPAAPEARARAAVAPPPASRPARSARAAGDAKELFEQARSLWRDGRIREAADAYQALLSTHPRDPRAGLAAFELGRLRMDRLNDMPGAVQALERAVVLAPGAELREDAMARLVAASAGAHDRAGCERARDQYLGDYPAGVHRRTVAAACGAR